MTHQRALFRWVELGEGLMANVEVYLTEKKGEPAEYRARDSPPAVGG